MEGDSISIISLRNISPQKENGKIDRNKKNRNLKTTNVSYWNGLYIFGILGTCIMLVSTQTLIPRHNSIIYPRFWFEVNLPVSIHIFLSSIGTVLDIFIFTKLEFLKSTFVVIKFFSWTLLGWLTPYVICYLIWSLYFGYNHPIPLLGLNMFISWFVSLVGVWYLFPLKLRTEKEIRRKLRAYILYRAEIEWVHFEILNW